MVVIMIMTATHSANKIPQKLHTKESARKDTTRLGIREIMTEALINNQKKF